MPMGKGYGKQSNIANPSSSSIGWGSFNPSDGTGKGDQGKGNGLAMKDADVNKFSEYSRGPSGTEVQGKINSLAKDHSLSRTDKKDRSHEL